MHKLTPAAEENNRRRVDNSARVLGLALLCVGFFLFHIWLRTRVVQEGYEVGASRRDVAELDAALVNLKVERNRIMGPENLQRLAASLKERGRNFHPPRPQEVFYLRSLPELAEKAAAKSQVDAR